MSTIRVNAIQNTSGVEVYTAKAWVNFNGTGTVAIRASGNVSSITDNGTGDYTVNFTTAMADANYNAVGSAAMADANNAVAIVARSTAYNTSSLRLWTLAGTSAALDPVAVNVAIFR